MISILKTRMIEYSERKKKGVKLRWFEGLSPKEMTLLGISIKKGQAKEEIAIKLP